LGGIIENQGALQTFWVAWKNKIVLDVTLKMIIWIMLNKLIWFVLFFSSLTIIKRK
jgi:hypothetical protein